jgi:hypothetical protein
MTKNLQDCIQVMEKEFILKDLIPVINSLSKDDSDQIRIIILETLITIATRFSKEENNKYLVSVLAEQYWTDRSWKVRESFSINFGKISDAFGKELTEAKLLPNLCKLITDSESEVRSQTLKSMCQWIHKISTDKISTVIIPAIKNLANDANNNVKLALSRLLGVLCKVCGEEVTANKL